MDEIEFPNTSWTLPQILQWAKKSLKFSEKDLEILEKNEIDGAKFIGMTNVKIQSLRLVGGPTIKLEAMNHIAKYANYHKEVVEYQKKLMTHISELYKRNFSLTSEVNVIQSAKIWKVWDINHATKEEKIASMLALMDRLQDSPNENVVPVSLKMPLVEFENTKTRVMRIFNTNLIGHGKTEKYLHRFCTIAGAKGTGKSRICYEVKGWCEEFVKKHPQIEILVPIYVDISNCENTKLFQEFENSSKIIGPRMLCSAFSKSVADFQTEVDNHPDILTISEFETAVATIRYGKPTGLCAILLVIDEFNGIADHSQWYQNVLRTIGKYMTSGWATIDNVVIFPVIAGTVFHEFDRVFYHTSYEASVIDLEPFSKQSISKIFLECLPTHAAWLNFKPFKKFLHFMASTPKVLQELIEMIETIPGADLPTLTDLKELGTTLKQKLVKKGPDTRDYQYINTFDHLLHFILAGTRTHYVNIQYQYLNLSHLQIEGVVYRQGPIHRTLYLPYYLMLRANETYGRYPKRIQQSLVPLDLLPIPGLPFTWETFKKLDHRLDVIRIKAQRFASSEATPPLYKVFQAIMNSPIGPEFKILPRDLCCVTELEPFMQGEQLVEKFKTIKTSRGTVVENFYSDYSFLCTDCPMVDGRMFFKTVQNEKIMLVKYYYVGQHNNENSSEIEIDQVMAWYEKLKKSMVKVAEDYHIFYLFITNKTVNNFHFESFLPKRVMLVHSKNFRNYYGPFVAQFVELIDGEDESEDKMEID